ncbi:MAG: GyrI-like domain-containing protein [Gammaproteobacteria bacterium]|nr:GyrI-like domain-containing protein [Gammaproteobacteria bacterium]
MKKIDLKKIYKDIYSGKQHAAILVEVPKLRYLSITGRGDPNTAPAYRQAVATLFTLSYTLKFMFKKSDLQIDYGVMPLEGLWWSDDMSAFLTANKDRWQWQAMILQPEFVTQPHLDTAIVEARKKHADMNFASVMLQEFAEGRCAQVLHVGPYADEGPTIAALHAYIEAQGYRVHGKHHEIYLSQPERTAPEKLKTLIRQPVLPI